VTLVLACVFMIGWMRSGYFIDIVNIPRKNRTSLVARSNDGHIAIAIIREHDLIVGMTTLSTSDSGLRGGIFGEFLQEITSRDGLERWSTIVAFFAVPYWPIVFPLTALSAWLLISNRTSKKPVNAHVPLCR
jgi:hypothetical protein